MIHNNDVVSYRSQTHSILRFFVGDDMVLLRSELILFMAQSVNLKRVSPAARLAQSVEHETLNLRVVGSSHTLSGSFLL